MKPQIFQIGPVRLSLALPNLWRRVLEEGWRAYAGQGCAHLTVAVEIDRSLGFSEYADRSRRVRRRGHHLQISGEDFVLEADLELGQANLRMANAIEPLLNAVRFLLAAKLEGKGLMLHASAVVGRHGAVAFFGASGRGKSTVSSKVVSCCRRLADDTVLLTREGGRGWRAWSTPLSLGTLGCYPLIGICALRRGNGAFRKSLPRSLAVPELMNNVVVPGDQQSTLASVFSTVAQLVSDVEVSLLHFYPGPELLREVAEWVGPVNENQRAA